MGGFCHQEMVSQAAFSMTQILSLIWVAAVLVTLTKGGYNIKRCEKDGITAVVSDSFSLDCYTESNRQFVLNWTLEADNGAMIPLATCEMPPGACKELMAGLDISIDDNPVFSLLQISSVTTDFSGTVSCTVITEDTEEKTSCRINVVHVRSVFAINDVEQGRSCDCYCDIAKFNQRNISWALTLTNGTQLDLGTSVNGEEMPLFKIFSKSTYSKLIMTRDTAGNLTCTMTWDNQTEQSRMIVNVYSEPAVENCTVEIIPFNWSCRISCDVSNAYSSNNIYLFQVKEISMPIFELDSDETSIASSVLSQTEDWEGSFDVNYYEWLPYRHFLTPYVDDADGETYFKGQVTYSWRLPVSEDNFYFASMRICCTSRKRKCRQPSTKYIYLPRISKPSPPTHNCTGLSSIPEKDGPLCVCTAADLGTPAGRLVWLIGDVPVATGDYNVSQLSLPTDQMTRVHDKMTARCRLEWTEPQEVTLLLNIAYGPDKVEVLRITANESVTVLECHVSEANPKDTLDIQWTGPCHNSKEFRCVLQAADNFQEKIVSCQVTNSLNNNVIAAAVKLMLEESESGDSYAWSFALVAVLLALQVGVVVLIMKIYSAKLHKISAQQKGNEEIGMPRSGACQP